MGTMRMLAAARRKRKALHHTRTQRELDDGMQPAGPLRSWLFSCLLGVFLAPAVVLLANTIANFPRKPFDVYYHPLDSFAVPSLATGETLATLAVLATVVVALAFTRGLDQLPPDEAAAQALNRRRLSSAAFALGAAATALSIIHAVGRTNRGASEGELLTGIMEAGVVLLAAQAVTFTAAQTQPRPGELELAAVMELPRLLRRHHAILLDQRLRWGFHATARAGVAALASAGILTVGIPVLLLFLIGGLARRAFSGDDAAVGAIYSASQLGLTVAAVLGMLTIFATMSDHLWPTTVIGVLGCISIATGFAWALIFSLDEPSWASLYWLAWGSATTFIWPFALIAYPATAWLRRSMAFLCWPIHILRLFYFASGTDTRRKVIKTRQRRTQRPAARHRST